MIKQIISLLLITVAFYTKLFSVTVLEDLNKEQILTPSLKTREVLKIRLDNELEAILISDPLIEQSAAAMIVKVGNFEDAKEYPGIAHFLEHMLFLGTKKYPQESGYQQFIAENGGLTNAFTSNDFTGYLFSVDNHAFAESLDRFSEFFKEPLFNPSGVARELQAIDQEYAKNVQNDQIREIYVMKEVANPNHPYHRFGMGNSNTLSKVSQSSLIDWYEKHYSANLMRLIVYSKLPLDELKALVVQDFSDIPNRTLTVQHLDQKIRSENTRAKMYYIEPVKHLKSLSLIWYMPKKFSHLLDKQPEKIVCHVLGNEGENSLLAELQKIHLAENLGCGSFKLGEENSVFYLDIDLTEEGIKRVDEVIEKVFQAIADLRDSGIPKYLFDDVQQISRIKYRYKNREDIFESLMKDAMKLPYEDIQTFPLESEIPQHFDPASIKEFIDFLTPWNAEFFILAPPSLTHVEPDTTEKWLGVKYAARPIAKSQMEKWQKALAVNEIKIPLQNHFIPKNLSILNEIEIPNEDIIPIPQPKAIIDGAQGRVYFAKDRYFGTPEIYLSFEIKTPKIKSGTSSSVVLADLYVKTLKDALNKFSYPAKVSGLDYEIQRTDNGISIIINGFNDNANLLFEEIVKQLAIFINSSQDFAERGKARSKRSGLNEEDMASAMSDEEDRSGDAAAGKIPDKFMKVAKQLNQLEISEEKFAIFKESLLREYENAYKSSPIKVASDLLKSALYKFYTTEPEKTESIKKIDFQTFKEYLSQVFKQNYVEGIIYGNIDEQSALTLTHTLLQTLPKKNYSKQDLLKKEVLVLPKAKGPFYLEKKVDVQGNAIILIVEDSSYSFKARAAQQILMQAIASPFFSTLRTKQQTGYLVDSSSEEIENKLFNLFVIQSNTHDVHTLLARIELFLEGYSQEIGQTNISNENFHIIKAALIQNLTHTYNNIQSMGELLKTLAFKYDGDFNWMEKRIAAFHELTYEEFLTLAKDFFSKANKQRLAILIHGEIPKENSLHYIKLQSVKQLQKISEYLGR